MRKKNTTTLALTIASFIFFASVMVACSSAKNINNNYLYFRGNIDTVVAQQKETIIQPNDLISIQVFSRTLNQEQAAIFNIPNTSNGAIQGYQVNTNGTIEMPVIGSIKAAGLSKSQLQSLLVQKLTDYVKNPSVLIRFIQFNVNVLGEVRSPGRHNFIVDKVTIIDALSAAGDLTDYGKREDVTVIREVDGKRIYHTVDLRSRALFQSPVYIMQPNDIIYVGPNKNKLKNLSIDPDAQRRTGLLFNIISLTLSIGSFLIYTLRIR